MQLDVASRALLMKILEDATQEAVRRQAKVCILTVDGHTFTALIFLVKMTMIIKFKISLSADANAIRFSNVPCARERALHTITLPDTPSRSNPEATGLAPPQPPGQ